jgi:hypothetical protein
MKRIAIRFWLVFPLVGAMAVVASVHIAANQAERQSLQESYSKDNYSRIEDGLCLGGMLSQPPSGTKAVLNVCGTKDIYVAEVHRWKPIPDLGPAPDFDWLTSQVKFMDEQRKAGRPVYVHCRAGVNRSVMVVAAYLMWRDGSTRDEALAIIRAKRPRAGPFGAYQTYLSDWEKRLRAKTSAP